MTATETKWTPERIRELRRKNNWTLKDAAARVGVTARTWLSWELPSQERQPPLSRQMLLDLLEKRKI